MLAPIGVGLAHIRPNNSVSPSPCCILPLLSSSSFFHNHPSPPLTCDPPTQLSDESDDPGNNLSIELLTSSPLLPGMSSVLGKAVLNLHTIIHVRCILFCLSVKVISITELASGIIMYASIIIHEHCEPESMEMLSTMYCMLIRI